MGGMDDTIFWVSVGLSDGVPTDKQMDEFVEQLSRATGAAGIENEFIVTAKEIEPMGRDELTDYLNNALDAVEDHD